MRGSQAVHALAALRREERHHVIARRDRGDVAADGLDHTSALVAEHGRARSPTGRRPRPCRGRCGRRRRRPGAPAPRPAPGRPGRAPAPSGARRTPPAPPRESSCRLLRVAHFARTGDYGMRVPAPAALARLRQLALDDLDEPRSTPPRTPRRRAPRPSPARAARCPRDARAPGRGPRAWRSRPRPPPRGPRRRRSPRGRRPRRCAGAAGSRWNGLASAREPEPRAPATSSAAAMPSPVGANSVQMMWPDCSPPRLHPRSRQRSRDVPVADVGGCRPRRRPPPSPGGSRSWSSP